MSHRAMRDAVEIFVDNLPRQYLSTLQQIDDMLSVMKRVAEARYLREFYNYNHQEALRKAEEKREAKEKRRKQLEQERIEATQALIDIGTLRKGSFIKVVGARDSKSIREVMDIHNSHDTLTCRKWSRVSITPEPRNDPIDAWRTAGCLKIDGKWYQSQPYMTTHGFGKVVRVIAS